mgnify:CR=1 FL=1
MIINAPVQFLTAGIGDALSTYYEGLSNERKGHPNYIWCYSECGISTLSARAIARACMETLYHDGLMALECAKSKTISPQFENVVEANILMSGIGFENVGCSVAHAIGNAFTAIPEGEKKSHGERVGFGTLSLLIAEEYPNEEIEKAFNFCIECGIPTTLEDLGIDNDIDKLRIIAKSSLTASSGVCGFGMGATPNAMANMQAICERYVPSVKAYLLVPLIGSLFADFLNSLVITFFINFL